MTHPDTATPGPMHARGPREQFLDVYQKEHAVTEKVLRAFPADRGDFRPHERSNSALQLAWTFVVEERMMLLAVRGQEVLGSGFPAAPETMEGVLAAFAAQHDELVRALREADDSVMDGTVRFYTGPGQVGEYRTGTFLWFMLHDQIHHRGQLSVYVRMAGGKVPSIYGPTADEPWR
ncbi:MAG TPA: DinB family protein [Gemmatimonadaceae bacterium]|nr:DinB family protein [Gemmatimonadaceae bacterium]